jgi:hypothetical protein
MKKIDILNFITNFRQSPNDTKTHKQLLEHLGLQNEAVINEMLTELKNLKVVREVDLNGEKAYQVAKK